MRGRGRLHLGLAGCDDLYTWLETPANFESLFPGSTLTLKERPIMDLTGNAVSGYGCQIAELAPDLYVMHDGDASEPLATESATSSFFAVCGTSPTPVRSPPPPSPPPPPPPPPPPCVDGIIDESTLQRRARTRGASPCPIPPLATP